MSAPFLTAEWRKLCLFTYAVEPALLASRLAPGLSLDTREGHAFVSLVAFDFLDTRVRGVAWPGYRRFPEVNLRFYVRHGDERGVMFIRELVPKRAIAFIARALYREPYVRAPMRSKSGTRDGHVEVAHELDWKGRTHRLRVRAADTPSLPATDSLEDFFKEHSHGFGVSKRGRLLRYEVQHPRWEIYPVDDWTLDWSFAQVYGDEWRGLDEAEPMSVMLAEGSAVSVSPLADR